MLIMNHSQANKLNTENKVWLQSSFRLWFPAFLVPNKIYHPALKITKSIYKLVCHRALNYSIVRLRMSTSECVSKSVSDRLFFFWLCALVLESNEKNNFKGGHFWSSADKCRFSGKSILIVRQSIKTAFGLPTWSICWCQNCSIIRVTSRSV